MQWIIEKLVRFPFFHHIAEIHYENAVGDVLYDRQVVRDKDVGQPQLVLQLFQKVDYLRLHRHVERGHRFVTDNEFRIDGKRPCDADSLSLSARKFMRVSVVILVLQSALFHNVADVRFNLFFRHDFMHAHGFRNDVPDCHTWGKAGIRILKNKLHIGAIFSHLAFFDIRNVVAFEIHLAAVGVVQTKYRPAERRFSATRLAHDADGFTVIDRKRYVVDGFQR